MDLKQELYEEIIRHLIKRKNREIICEALSVADKVITSSQTLGGFIIDMNDKTNPIGKVQNARFKKFAFYYDFMDEKILIVCYCYDYPSEELIPDEMKTNGKTLPEEKKIVFRIVGSNSKIDKRALFDTIQHELSHLYEMKHRNGVPYKNFNNYKIATNIMHSDNSSRIEWTISKCIYISYRFEQRAFANGLYQFIKQNGHFEDGYKDAIEESLAYKWYTYLLEYQVYIEDYINKYGSIEKYLKVYDKVNTAKLFRLISDSRKGLIHLIGRVVAKVKYDTMMKEGIFY